MYDKFLPKVMNATLGQTVHFTMKSRTVPKVIFHPYPFTVHVRRNVEILKHRTAPSFTLMIYELDFYNQGLYVCHGMDDSYAHFEDRVSLIVHGKITWANSVICDTSYFIRSLKLVIEIANIKLNYQ